MNALPAAGSPISESQFFRIYRFLCQEAALLSEGAYQHWFKLLEPTIHYQVMPPTFTELGRTSTLGYGRDYFNDDWDTLKIRVEQLTTPNYTIAENPKSVTRYLVSNIDGVVAGEGFEVTSTVLVYRIRATEPNPSIVTAARRDLLIDGEAGITLKRRVAQLDQVSLQQPNFSIFI
jgi:3-phenylpropionate/cinnamic acid dioxygenase small subunit